MDNQSFSDLEDSLQNECAIVSDVDYIVTRNLDDFKDTTIPVIEPKDFIEIIRKQK